MRLAFCLNYYFPYGGLQRDFLQIAERARDRGHEIDVFTMEWQGDYPFGIKLHFLPCKGLTNHGRCMDYIKKVMPILQRKKFDLVIGFNKMPGLDLYYAADPCFTAKHQETFFLKRLMPRYQYYLRLEQAVFSEDSKTHILVISDQQKQLYQKYYQTSDERFHALPPPLHPSRKPTEESKVNAIKLRTELAGDHKNVLIIVASAFHTKGVDRVIRAMASLPEKEKSDTVLWVIGQDEASTLEKLTTQSNLQDQVKFLGARDDVVQLYLAADLMVHPARSENTGTVLLEALLAGCPVITTQNCGYAEYISNANAGIVLPEPFEQKALDQALGQVLSEDRAQLEAWSDSGITYASTADFFSMPDKALEVIEHVAKLP